MATDVLAHRRVGGQQQQPGRVLGNPELPGRAKHSRGFDAAHLGHLDQETAGQFGARQRTRHLDADCGVRRATDDLQRFPRPDVDAADVEAVGARMLVDAEHLRDDDLVEARRDRLFGFHFEAGHGQQMRELMPRARRIDEAAKPGFRKFHGRSMSGGNTVRQTAAGSAGRHRRTGAGH